MEQFLLELLHLLAHKVFGIFAQIRTSKFIPRVTEMRFWAIVRVLDEKV